MQTFTEQDIVPERINVPLLVEELATAGFGPPTFYGHNLVEGTLSVTFDISEEDRAAVLSILDAHNPEALSTKEQIEVKKRQILAGNKSLLLNNQQMRALLSMTVTQLDNYLTNNTEEAFRTTYPETYAQIVLIAHAARVIGREVALEITAREELGLNG